MDQSYYKVNKVTTLPKSCSSSKDHHSNQQKEEKKEEEKTFRIEEKETTSSKKTVSTLWGIYNLFQEGEIKSEELTGSTIYDLFTMLMKDQEEIDSSLMDRYQTLQNTQGLDRFTDKSPKRIRTLNAKNYEKYSNSKET